MMTSLIRVYREDAPQPNVSDIVTRFDKKNQRKIFQVSLNALYSDVRQLFFAIQPHLLVFRSRYILATLHLVFKYLFMLIMLLVF